MSTVKTYCRLPAICDFINLLCTGLPMPFHTQLGRFGDEAKTVTGSTDPDLQAADIIAANIIPIANRPDLVPLIARKGFWDPNSIDWTNWVTAFGGRCKAYITAGGVLLRQNCPRSSPGVPAGFCLHEMTPPLNHGNLNWFNRLVGSISDNIQIRADGSVGVDPSSKPVWNFIINETGEIVTGSEDFEQIKHTCLAAGIDVWSAGQLGIKSGLIYLVDLQSGHYVRPNVLQGTTLAKELISFTQDIFRGYCGHFGIPCLDPHFSCIWG